MLNKKEVETDRRTGILTTDQRKYLVGDKSGVSRSQQSQYRTAIRERFKNALLDFTLLFECWEDDERERTFDEVTGDWSEYRTPISDMIALVYMETFVQGRFKTALTRGVQNAERRLAESETYNVKTNFDVERVSGEDLKNALETTRADRRMARNNLSDKEKLALIDMLLYVDADVWEDAWQNMRERFSDYEAERGEAGKRHAEKAREKMSRDESKYE
jgi:hypothetical protein